MTRHNLSTLFVAMAFILSAFECNPGWAQDAQLLRPVSEKDLVLNLKIEDGLVVGVDVYHSTVTELVFGQAFWRNGRKLGTLVLPGSFQGHWEFEFPRRDGDFDALATWIPYRPK